MIRGFAEIQMGGYLTPTDILKAQGLRLREDTLPAHKWPYHHLDPVGTSVPRVAVLTQVEEIPHPSKEPPFYFILAL